MMPVSTGSPSSRNGTVPPTAQQDVARLAGLPSVHIAFDWFSSHARELSDWQLEITRVPAPPFGESERADFLRARFEQAGLEDVHIDGAGNVIGTRHGTDQKAKYILISAHLDTVFPPETDVRVKREGEKLFGPGISDNSCGLTALLALAHALHEAGIQTQAPLLFVANVGEEGEGDLRGMRFLFSAPQWRDQIAETLVLDGGGSDTIITEGLGSRRFLVTVRGPGGHSWSDFGVPNPIVMLAHIIDIANRTPVPDSPKTTFNIGVISGGTSVNSIPESASMKVDIRSASTDEIDRVENTLRAACTQAQEDFSAAASGDPRKSVKLAVEVRAIGNRPAAELAPDAHILEAIRAVDAQLGVQSRLQRASTDANIPLSMGREAVTIGGGGIGGGAHTLHEWYDPTTRELGLKRILLAVLALAGSK
jgi:acetylornithine deacetylase/succinyl-diaminopimelate desuccinylase-like protein